MSNLLIHNHIDLHPSLSSPLKYLIKPPLLVEIRRSPQKQLRRKPPICDVYNLLSLFQSNRHGPEVVSAIDIPLYLVSPAFRRKGVVSVGLCDGRPFPVSGLLVFLVMAMVWVEEVLPFANLVLYMGSFYFGFFESVVAVFS